MPASTLWSLCLNTQGLPDTNFVWGANLFEIHSVWGQLYSFYVLDSHVYQGRLRTLWSCAAVIGGGWEPGIFVFVSEIWRLLLETDALWSHCLEAKNHQGFQIGPGTRCSSLRHSGNVSWDWSVTLCGHTCSRIIFITVCEMYVHVCVCVSGSRKLEVKDIMNSPHSPQKIWLKITAS